ncbi:MAG: DNA mismatch repair protein MutS, partial [Spirochaetae bacterium HGW-Spirochaetae-6]
RFVPPATTLYLPESTIRNLELLEPLFTDQSDTSLFSHLNKTQTSMGARELRSTLVQPPLDQKLIEERQDQVAFFLEKESLEQETRQLLKQVPDLERLLAKITLHKAHPKEIISFKVGLIQLEKLKSLPLPFFELPTLPPLTDAFGLIEKTIYDDPPVQFDEGGVIREGLDAQLDEYKVLTTRGKEYLLEIEEREKNKTGLSKLRLRYNKVIGYYFEISKTQSKDIPSYFIRKQSLVGSERYTIDDLISFETKILDAKSRLVELEKKLYFELLEKLSEHIDSIQRNLDYLKKVDILCAFSYLARVNRYTRPRMHQQGHLLIEDGRHPVVETFVDRFTANSVYLDSEESRLILLTGPNMAGKSTYLRQTALIVLLAHLGSFVPASRAEIPLTDQIFTRIGASDNLAGGESTFLVEMSETSQILRNTTERSLIIMDEVGRGTSTHDGLSLAWAIVEHLCEKGTPRGKTLFATHYHELTVLGQEKGIQNLRMAVQEWKNQIVFLHKVETGAADKSYGIHVAEIAGIPSSVINRAQEILNSMEISLLSQEKTLLKNEINSAPSLFQVENDPFAKIKSQLLSLDLQHTTPLQALVFLEEIQEKLRKK